MIEEQYVSFEVAKLLKEKGFDEKCQKVYLYNGKTQWAQNFIEEELFVNNEDIDSVSHYKDWITYTQGDYAYLCPTQQMAMKWLREVHNLFICIEIGVRAYVWSITDISNDNVILKLDAVVDSYEETVETALKYLLENLIK